MIFSLARKMTLYLNYILLLNTHNVCYDISHIIVKSGWSNWTPMSRCIANYLGECTKASVRFCVSENRGLCPGADKYGTQSNVIVCEKSECDGMMAFLLLFNNSILKIFSYEVTYFVVNIVRFHCELRIELGCKIN